MNEKGSVNIIVFIKWKVSFMTFTIMSKTFTIPSVVFCECTYESINFILRILSFQPLRSLIILRDEIPRQTGTSSFHHRMNREKHENYIELILWSLYISALQRPTAGLGDWLAFPVSLMKCIFSLCIYQLNLRSNCEVKPFITF